MENEKIRILNFVPNMRAAGIESFIMNVYRNIDTQKVQFDFIVHSQKREFFDDEIEKLGGKIYRLSFKDDKNIFKYIKDLNMFFKQHKEYKIVHGHMQSMMPLYLLIAKINKVPIRIAHSHNGNYEKTLKGFILHIFSKFSKKVSTINLACSEVAGKYLFNNKQYDIIYNGINTNEFQFNEENRKKIRKELNLEDKFVIGHIGRFELQKNHEFIIDVFNEVVKKNKDARLILIGEGKLETSIKEKVELLSLEKNVLFLGLRKDVNVLYQGMDCFILPSLYEGLPVVGIEAQIAGKKCIFSNNITKELKISNNTYFEELKVDLWCDKIINFKEIDKEINFEKFEIKRIAKQMQKLYENELDNLKGNIR